MLRNSAGKGMSAPSFPIGAAFRYRPARQRFERLCRSVAVGFASSRVIRRELPNVNGSSIYPLERTEMRMIRKMGLAASVAVAMAFGTVTAKAADIVDTAVAAGDFTTLAAALEAAGLVETLKGPGPFTVFAPTDQAFSNLPAGTVQDLLKPENKDRLIAILTYHVVPGTVRSYDLEGKKQFVETVQGDKLTVRAFNDVRVDEAKVIAPDIIATNGVIHVIDQVVMPQ